MIQLRPATVADASACTAIERERFSLRDCRTSDADEVTVAGHRKNISRLKRSNGFYLVAVEKAQVLGFAYLLPASAKPVSHIYRLFIAVAPDHGDRGIGSTLAAALLAWAHRNERVAKIEVIVRSTNPRARSLYAKFGFVPEGRLRRRLGGPAGSLIDDITMAYFPMGAAHPAHPARRRTPRKRRATELQP